MIDTTAALLEAARRLQQQEQPFAWVSVVRVHAPASARAGDKALVTDAGIAHGWIGGGCAQPAVLRAVRLALRDGRARLIRIAPVESGPRRDAREAVDDALEFGMSCQSGGTLELFIDPLLPAARLTVIGDSPVAVALAGLAPRVGLRVTAVAHGADASRYAEATSVITTDDAAAVVERVEPGSYVVVATQGRRDVQGLRAALALQARRVWFVASARKAQVLCDSLIEAGSAPEAVRAIVAPAGQSIGAQTPEEIALSVLAAVVAERRGGSGELHLPRAATAAPAAAAGSCCAGGAAAVTSDSLPADAAVVPGPGAGRGSCCGG
jgi:xanthine dehydrogenase accessory factor